MLKATQHNLKKLETIYKESGFRVRYGKGNFQAGYCILDDQNQIVVNKFYSIEIKMGILTDLLTKVRIDKESLSDASLKAVQQQKVVLKELEPIVEVQEGETEDENNIGTEGEGNEEGKLSDSIENDETIAKAEEESGENNDENKEEVSIGENLSEFVEDDESVKASEEGEEASVAEKEEVVEVVNEESEDDKGELMVEENSLETQMEENIVEEKIEN